MTGFPLRNHLQMVKLYPEGEAEARFKISGVRRIYAGGRHGCGECLPWRLYAGVQLAELTNARLKFRDK